MNQSPLGHDATKRGDHFREGSTLTFNERTPRGTRDQSIEKREITISKRSIVKPERLTIDKANEDAKDGNLHELASSK